MLIGTLSAFTTYAVGIFEPIQQMARNLAEFISARPTSSVSPAFWTKSPRWWFPGGHREVRRQLFPKKENWEPIKGDIEFRDVSFHYPDGKEEILSHFNLKIPGQEPMWPIVGRDRSRKKYAGKPGLPLL